MLKAASLVTLLAVLASASIAAAAPTLDAQGKCRDGGKFVAAAQCKKPSPAAAGKCRDKTTKKFAACSAANAEPVPAKKP